MKKTYTTTEAARLIGVSRPTLLYWFKVRGVEDVPRDYNGWRVFTDEDIARLKRFRAGGGVERALKLSKGDFGVERRRWVRANIQLPVHYAFRGVDSALLEEGKAQTMDISLGGVMFGALLRVLFLHRVSLEIGLAGSNTRVTTEGEVRWARRSNGGHQLGVRFTNVAERDRALIADCIARSMEG